LVRSSPQNQLHTASIAHKADITNFAEIRIGQLVEFLFGKQFWHSQIISLIHPNQAVEPIGASGKFHGDCRLCFGLISRIRGHMTGKAIAQEGRLKMGKIFRFNGNYFGMTKNS
jgi:hypothetical protein